MRGTPTARELAALGLHRPGPRVSKDIENAVTGPISAAIARISVLDDGTGRFVPCLQTAEILGALLNILAATLTASRRRPDCRITDGLHRGLIKRVAAAKRGRRA
jgi:hypothetical protein